MNKFSRFYLLYKNTIIFGIIVIVIGGLSFTGIYFFGILDNNKDNEDQIIELEEIETLDSDNKDENLEKIEDNEIEDAKKLIKVDIKGKVKNPGVYVLNEGDRVLNAIEAAGGISSDADTSVTNLSKRITDEMVIIIYSKTEVKNFVKTKDEENQKQNACNKDINDSCINLNEHKDEVSNKKISLNTATLEELMTLSGIGEEKAKLIIEYRNTNGKFNNIEELLNIKGIGQAIFDKIKDNITI